MSRISFAEWVRSLDDVALADLLSARPDVRDPAPASIDELIERAGSAAGVKEAITRLDAWQHRVLEAVLALEPPVRVTDLAEALDEPAPDIERALADLTVRALTRPDGDAVIPTLATRTIVRFPAGLAPHSAAEPLAAVADRLAGIDDDARQALERLVWGPPLGAARNARHRGEDGQASSAVDALLARGLLRVVDDETVQIPREVALEIRGGQFFRDRVQPHPPAWEAPAASASRISDGAGVGTASEFVQHVTAVLESVSGHPIKALARGGIAKKDVSTLGTITSDIELAGFVCELAIAAGLMAQSADVWLPTKAYDDWLQRPSWEKWRRLQLAHRTLGAPTGEVASTVDDPAAAGLRADIIADVASAPHATPMESGHVADRVAWRHPSWQRDSLPQDCARVLSELTWLGVVALGRVTTLATAESDPGFPEPVESLIIESDLSAIAPGQLKPDLARVMAMLAVRESHGGGTVYRFTRASVRAGMDAGWTGEQMTDWISEHSDTGVPQPLRYLIADVERDYGRVEVAAVSAVVTMTDPAHAVALLRHPDADDLGLRELAPGVVSATGDPVDVVEVLQSLGLAPLARKASGERWVAPPPRRAPSTRREPAMQPESDNHALARQILAGPVPDPADRTQRMLATLRHAQESGTWVELTYVDPSGVQTRATARVLAVGQGAARVVPRASAPITVSLSRLVAAVAVHER